MIGHTKTRPNFMYARGNVRTPNNFCEHYVVRNLKELGDRGNFYF